MIKYFILILTLFMGVSFSTHAQRSDSIAAVVNGDIITYTDLYDRMDLVIKSSRMPNTKEFKERLLPQVLTGLITENIQIQEATRLGLQTNQEEIDQGFGELAKQNNMAPQQFKSILKKQNIQLSSVYKQIESQLAWGKVIQAELRPRVNLTDGDIDTELNRLKSKQGQPEYFIAEIFLPFTADQDEVSVRNAATDLSKQLSSDIKKFPAAARQFSQSATAANGGIIGWVTEDQIDEDTSLFLRNMTEGAISKPIKTNDGYRLIFLRDKRLIALNANNDAPEKLHVKIAVFSIPNNTSDHQILMDYIANFKQDVKGCLDIVKKITDYKGGRLQEYDDIITNIPSNIVAAVDSINIGDIGSDIESENSLMVPMLCGRDGGNNDFALEQEIEQKMGTQRLDSLQKQYLRDLITDAYIERRV